MTAPHHAGRRRRVGSALGVAVTVALTASVTSCSAGARHDPAAAVGQPPTTVARATTSPTGTTTPTTPTDPTTPTASTNPTTEGPTADGTAADGTATALAALATLPVKGRAPQTGYDRDLFGQRWADTDRNGCDTRNDVLRRDLTDVVLDPATNGCVVLSGTLADPFSGGSIAFERGAGSAAVQIDHVVALSDAWQKGAQQWAPARRVAFANDPLNLLAVDGPLNQRKSDGDAATWLPPHRAFRCAYVARQVAVKAKYGAWVTQAERDAITRVLSACPGEPVPTSEHPVEVDVGRASTPATAAPSAAPASPAAPVGPDAADPGCDPSYPEVCIPPRAHVGDLDCSDVAPRRFRVIAPDPHGFDGNRDGVGCESE